MQRLRKYDAVKTRGGQSPSGGDVAIDRGPRHAGPQVQNVLMYDALGAKSPRITVIAYFQHIANDGVRISAEKVFYVVAIDRATAVQSEIAADGGNPAQVAE